MSIPTRPPAASNIKDNYRHGSVGEFLRDKIKGDAALSFVSAYFTIYAFDALKDQLAAYCLRGKSAMSTSIWSTF